VKKYRVAVIPGDGVGGEVMTQGLRVLERLAADDDGFGFDFVHYEWSCEYYLKNGRMMSEDGLERLADSDAILLGAVGYPGVPDHVSLRELLLKIRQGFDQYVNYRPCVLLHDDDCPIKGKRPEDIDIAFVRENVEGEYSGLGGRLRRGSPDEAVVQSSIFTRKNTEKVMKWAFEIAESRGPERRKRGRKAAQKVTSATKSNALNYSMVFWDECFAEVASSFPDVSIEQFHVDALSMYLVQRPEDFDVIVASNLFGDILTDLGAVLQGGLGFAAGGNLNPERQYPSMFEPVHGSAPTIAGKGIANPIAMIWTAKLMLDFLGHEEAGTRVLDAIRTVVAKNRQALTQDMGGTGSTADVGDLILGAL
jgi:tartrate dehydrogenase/decarboxylase/D-malate dehydrogenase